MKTITIGRSSSCDIVVPDSNVSRVHAEIKVAGGMYVYKDISKNGSTLNGEYINNRSVQIAPGAPVMLSGRIPLPWAQIYALLPLNGARPYEAETNVIGQPVPARGAASPAYATPAYSPSPADEPSVGLNILAFLIPLVGWILYFALRKDTPERASSCATWAWIGLAVNVVAALIL